MNEKETGVDELARAVWGSFTEDESNVATGLHAIATGLQAVAAAIHKLGLSDASTPMGAIENLSLSIKEGFEQIMPLSYGEQLEMISGSLDIIAEAIANTSIGTKCPNHHQPIATIKTGGRKA